MPPDTKPLEKKPFPPKDDRKPVEAEVKAPPKEFWTTSTIIIAVALLYVVFSRFNVDENGFSAILERLKFTLPEPLRYTAIGYIIFAGLLSFFFLFSILFVLIRMREVEASWVKLLYKEEVVFEPRKQKNTKWMRVEEHISSDNPSDWRLAILEADILLDELLDDLGYPGDTIGDKLKKVSRGDFQMLDSAWEAHKIRNAIAHEGQDFALTQRDAQRIVGLYRNVFEEFEFIDRGVTSIENPEGQ